jgi:hypothetical protein
MIVEYIMLYYVQLKNPYIIKLVEECINNIELEYYGYNSLCITCSIFTGTIFYKYENRENNDILYLE